MILNTLLLFDVFNIHPSYKLYPYMPLFVKVSYNKTPETIQSHVCWEYLIVNVGNISSYLIHMGDKVCSVVISRGYNAYLYNNKISYFNSVEFWRICLKSYAK